MIMCIPSFQANNLNPLFVPALTVEDVFRNTMAKLFSRRTEKKENGGEREASCVSCVVSKKCSGMLQARENQSCQLVLSSQVQHPACKPRTRIQGRN